MVIVHGALRTPRMLDVPWLNNLRSETLAATAKS